MGTFTRKQLAEKYNVSGTMIARNLRSLLALGFEESTLIDEKNRLTDRCDYLIDLFRSGDHSMLEDELEVDREAAKKIEQVDLFPADSSGLTTVAQQSQALSTSIVVAQPVSADRYVSRAASSDEALVNFCQRAQTQADRLATNALATRRSVEAIGREHGVGHLMTYMASVQQTIAAGMADYQEFLLNQVDRMGQMPGESQASDGGTSS